MCRTRADNRLARYSTGPSSSEVGRRRYSVRTPNARASASSWREPGTTWSRSYLLSVVALTPTGLARSRRDCPAQNWGLSRVFLNFVGLQDWTPNPGVVGLQDLTPNRMNFVGLQDLTPKRTWASASSAQNLSVERLRGQATLGAGPSQLRRDQSQGLAVQTWAGH